MLALLLLSLLPVAIGDWKVIGGKNASAGEYPYQASLQSSSYHFCGGILIDPEWILTAAHCISGTQPEYINVILGDVILSVDEGTEQTIFASLVIVHENYTYLENDIGLLKLQSPVVINEFVQTIRLPKQGQEFTGDSLLSGWGDYNPGSGNSDILQAVVLPVVTDNKCRYYHGVAHVHDHNICAGGNGIGACYGDSGGPLVCKDKDVDTLCGIVSWGDSEQGCAQTDAPDVFVQASYFIDWINEKIEINS